MNNREKTYQMIGFFILIRVKHNLTSFCLQFSLDYPEGVKYVEIKIITLR